MKKANLAAQTRAELGRKTRKLRRQMLVPAVLYGKGIKNINLAIQQKTLADLLKNYGANALINLEIDQQKPMLVFLQDLQRHPVSDQIIHCDLWKIDPNQEIKTEIPVKPEGEAPAVEELEGILLQSKSHLNISALPDDLISEIKIDISGLKSFEDKIQVKDVTLPDRIKLLDDPEETIFTIQQPRSEEELEELEEKPEEDVEKVEVEEKGKETTEAEGAGEKPEQENEQKDNEKEEKPEPQK